MALKFLNDGYFAGKVGIGTNSPGAKLHVTRSSAEYNATPIVKIFDANTNQRAALEVIGYSNLGGFRINAADGIRGFYKSTTGGLFGIATKGDDPITFTQLDSAERMRIAVGGNVGIGRSSSITARLFVEGPVDTATISTSSTPAVRINNGGAISNWIGSNGYNYGYIQSIQDDGSNNLKPLSLQPLGGNVGIGTTSPGVKLDVIGTVRS